MRINLKVILRHFKCCCKVTTNISNTQIFFHFFSPIVLKPAVKHKNRRAEARLFLKESTELIIAGKMRCQSQCHP